MADAKIVLDAKGVAELLKSAQVRAPLHEIAQSKAGSARASAPRDTGDYAESIRVESDTTDRAVERVVAHDWKSTIVEAKTGNLKRALGR